MRGCYLYHKGIGGEKVDNVEVDCSTPATADSSTTSMAKSSSNSNEHSTIRQPARILVFIFQIIFQVSYRFNLITHKKFHLFLDIFRVWLLKN